MYRPPSQAQSDMPLSCTENKMTHRLHITASYLVILEAGKFLKRVKPGFHYPARVDG